MSSPVSAPNSCSRLSPYLAFGAAAMREVYHASQRRRQTLLEAGAAEFANNPRDKSSWLKSLTSFNSRLHWHCHFIQKLRMSRRAEFRAFHPAYRDWHKNPPDAARGACSPGETGRTGYIRLLMPVCGRLRRQGGLPFACALW